jgi:hypothetical protein
MWAVLSDGQLKKDVQDFRTGFAGLEKIRPVTFKYNGLAGVAPAVRHGTSLRERRAHSAFGGGPGLGVVWEWSIWG